LITLAQALATNATPPRTVSPISRHGTLQALVSISIEQSA